MTTVEGPRKVYVEPTNACNLDCRTCVRHSWDEPEGFMEWATFAAVVDGLAPAPASEAGGVAFMGLGEPLLHPRFLDMVRKVKESGLRAEVTTNALLLDDEMAAGLLQAGLDQLVVSIDGASAEAFGRVRSGASLERVVENVRRLHDAKGPNYGPSLRIGVEFVAMRSNVEELPGLGRLAAQLGATFIIVSNVLAYTEDLLAETLYDHHASSLSGAETTAAPRWQLPAFDWDRQLGAALGEALTRSGPVSFFGAETEATRSHCPFVEADACAVAWHGGVSPCPPLLHTYTCFVRGREKRMLRWEAGRLPDETLAGIWEKPEYVAFRDRVRRFAFPPCTDCGCELAEANEEDCFGNPHPACGDCLWARGVIRCA
ncbi:MAG TPA: radical SAM protein [Thermoleophilia bacterium]|nr:radical SAM protein [Thermoleophilia bacterium]